MKTKKIRLFKIQQNLRDGCILYIIVVNPDGVQCTCTQSQTSPLLGVYSIVCTTCVVVRMVGLWWSSLLVTPGRRDSLTRWSFRSAQWDTSLFNSPAEYPNNIFKSHTNLYTNLFPCTWKIIVVTIHENETYRKCI